MCVRDFALICLIALREFLVCRGRFWLRINRKRFVEHLLDGRGGDRDNVRHRP